MTTATTTIKFTSNPAESSALRIKYLPFLALLFIAGAVLGQSSLRFTLREDRGTLEDVLRDVQRETGYLYLVDTQCIREVGRLSFSMHDVTIEALLDSCLRHQPVYYRIVRHSVNVYPGTVVWGRVSDAQGQGLPGATVQAADAPAEATVSDEAGHFLLRLARRDRLVVVSCVGYESRPYRVSGAQPLPVVLTARIGELGGVTVSNGFEELPAERATGSVSHLSREDLGRRPSANILDRMDGITPSLLVNTNVIAGNNQSAITIRGRSTIFSNPNPLIIVDNFPYSGDINNLNPEDIESVTILKDAAAASVWGTRAANGVIVFTTRQGHYRQAPRLSVTSSLTVGARPNLYYTPILSSPDYIAVEQYLFNQGFYDNAINSPNHTALSPVVEILQQQRQGLLSAADTASLLGQLRRQDTRQDLRHYWYQPSVNQQYWLGFTGGTASGHYDLSAGLDRDVSNLTRNSYQRITVLGHSTYLLIPHRLEFNSGLAFASSTTDLNNTGNTAGPLPYLKLADATGHALATPFQLRQGYVDTVGGGRLLDWHYRPLDDLHNANNVTQLTDWRLNLGLQYTIGKGWQLQALYQYGQGASDQQNLQSLQTYYTRNLINSFTQRGPAGQLSYPIPVGDILDETNNNYHSHNGRLQLNFHPLLADDHDLHLLAGSEIQDVESRTSLVRTYGYNAASQTGLPVSSYTTLYPQYSFPGSLAPIPYPNNNISNSDHYWSYYANGGYQYRQRYTLTASGRLDQSNLFGVNINRKTLPLWSAGVAWELSRENFYHFDWLRLLRLRVTNGYNGNAYKAVSGYTTANAFSPVVGITSGYLNSYSSPAAAITNPPNPDLRWEQVHVINAAIDFASKDSLLQGSLEYYIKNGQYLIGPASLDPTTGNSQYTANVANMITHGIDLSLRTQLHVGPVQWTSMLLFNYVQDKVTRYLARPATILYFLGPTINPLAGHPLYSIYALRWAGLDPQTGNPQGWLNGHVSQDYTSLITSADFHTLVYKGPVNPPVFGNWRNSFTWKQWGLSMNLGYKFGSYFRRSSIQYFSLFNGTSVGHPDYKRRWQHPGDESHTSVPSMIYPADVTRDGFYADADVLIEKGDLIRLQDLQLYYDWSRKTRSHLPVQSLRLYLYANNLGLLWTANHQGIDPDALATLPNPRTVAIGIKCEL